jgi:poly-gamma-glutamate capsule biosynthesis protein CapA/YwtB (metallophosphatase superfamily)
MSAKLLFGGDVAILRDNPENPFGELTPHIRNADLAIANLEFALSDRGAPMRGKIYPHKSPASVLAALKDTGFDAFNLANNHLLDYGEEPLFDTLDALDGAGIQRFGAGRFLGEAEAPVIVEHGSLRIGLLGVTTTLPTGFAAGAEQCGVNPLRVTTAWRAPVSLIEYPGTAPVIETEPLAEDLARLTASVEKLKMRTDLVLVYVHWGTSMTERVHDFQRKIATAAIDAGASALFGGHQHVISGVEFIKGRPVIHGLGNLVFDFEAPFFTEATRRTIVFTADLTRDGLADCRLIPCRTGVKAPVEMLTALVGVGAEITETVRRLAEPFGTKVAAGARGISVAPA